MNRRRLIIAMDLLVPRVSSHGFVWKLKRGRVVVLRDLAPTADQAMQAAERAREFLESRA